jgi:hypothetical protein
MLRPKVILVGSSGERSVLWAGKYGTLHCVVSSLAWNIGSFSVCCSHLNEALYGPLTNSRKLRWNIYCEWAFTERAREKTLFTKKPEWERNKPNEWLSEKGHQGHTYNLKKRFVLLLTEVLISGKSRLVNRSLVSYNKQGKPEGKRQLGIFYVLLTVHLDAVLVMTNLMHSFLMYLFYVSTCFEQQVLIIRRSKLY